MCELAPGSDETITDADIAPSGELLVTIRYGDGRRECRLPDSGRFVPLPANADYVRGLPESRLLVISIRTNSRNGAVLDLDGNAVSVFELDAPICDALVDPSDGTFWVSYFRLGAPAGLAGEGLVRFDTEGRASVRFRSEFSGPESAGETHPFVLGEDTALWMCPEPEFRLLEIDWSRWKLRSRRVPWECHESDALAVRPPVAYFASPRQHPQQVMGFDFKNGVVHEAGTVRGRPRPVCHPRGVFLDILRREVVLLEPSNPSRRMASRSKRSAKK